MKTNITLAAAMAGVLLAAAPAGAALAADHQVRMLNRGAAGMMVFEPAYLAIEPGDTVTFLNSDPGHNAETAAGMLPAGAAPFKGAMSKEITVAFETEGLYGYLCKPHYAMGMVGLIKVGADTPNADAAKAAKHPGKAAKVMAALLATAGDTVAAVPK
jgi:pseudoazurin